MTGTAPRARHTAAQLALILLGLTLAAAAGPHTNSLYIIGYALAGFGVFRLARSIDQAGRNR